MTEHNTNLTGCRELSNTIISPGEINGWNHSMSPYHFYMQWYPTVWMCLESDLNFRNRQELSVNDIKTNVHVHIKHHSSSYFDVTFK